MTDPIVARLLTIATARFGDAASNLAADADLFDALGIDSLQALDLLTDLEEAFDVEIPDYELQDVRTVGGLAAIIARRV